MTCFDSQSYNSIYFVIHLTISSRRSNICNIVALFQIYINLEMTLQLQFNFVPREFALDITGSILITVEQLVEIASQISSVIFCHIDCISFYIADSKNINLNFHKVCAWNVKNLRVFFATS